MPSMAFLSPTFGLGVIVLLYLSSFVLFAVLRILTGISIQRVGYFSLRRLAYTPYDGLEIEIRGLGLNVHRPTFVQPTWLSIVVSELAVTVNLRELEGRRKKPGRAKVGDNSSDGNNGANSGVAGDKTTEELEGSLKPSSSANGRAPRGSSPSGGRSRMWNQLMQLKDKMKKLHRNLNWLRMVDVVATNSSFGIIDVGNVQVGSLTLAVDTRHKMVDRARFFFSFRSTWQKQERQAEWIMTLRSVLLTAYGSEPLEVLDNATLNIHGFLRDPPDGLRDATVALKLGRVHVPYDDILHCARRFEERRAEATEWQQQQPQRPQTPAKNPKPAIDIFVHTVIPEESSLTGDADRRLMQAVSDSKEFVSSILRGIKEVQFAVSFVGLTKKVQVVRPRGQDEAPVMLNASMKEVGIDLHRLDPRSPAHRMYFPSKDIAHEALAAALSISIGLDDGLGKPERILYVPMATTTARTTLPSRTMEMTTDGDAEERNQNILVANSVVTSPSIDLDPRHLSLLIALFRRPERTSSSSSPSGSSRPDSRHMLISRLLPKANIKFSMHEPVLRIALPPVDKTVEPDEFDLIISSISSVSLDLESFHSAVEDPHYSLCSVLRIQTHHLYYQASSGTRFDLIVTDALDVKAQIHATPNFHVLMTGNLQSCAIKMVRPEINEGLRQIVDQLRLEVEVEAGLDKQIGSGASRRRRRQRNFLHRLPAWLLHFQLEATDLSFEVSGVDEQISDDARGVCLLLETLGIEYWAHANSAIMRRRSRRRSSTRSINPDADFTRSPVSPTSKQFAGPEVIQSGGGERRLFLLSKGLEVFLIESVDRMEAEPFLGLPHFDLTFTTNHDRQGPIFDIKAQVRTILVQYSLYRHYAVGVAAMVLRRSLLQTRDGDEHKVSGSATGSAPGSPKHMHHHRQESEFLPLPFSPDSPGAGSVVFAEPGKELVTIDIRAALVQVRADLPNDPPLLLQIHNVEAGRKRWSPPYIAAKLIRLYVEAPRMRRTWARMVSVKAGRLDFRRARRKASSGLSTEEKSIDLDVEAIRIAVPHEVIVNKISDNLINTVKSAQQLHHRFRTGTDEYILEKGPVGPKQMPKMSLRARAVLFEIEDGAFEWKLGMIYRAGLVEQMQRLAREEAFEVKKKKVQEEDARRDSGGNTRFRGRSLFPGFRGATDSSTATLRSRSADHFKTRRRDGEDDEEEEEEEGGDRDGGGYDIGRNSRGRVPRYNPETGAQGLTGQSKRSEEEARQRLNVYNAQSWKRRVDRHLDRVRQTMRDARAEFWGSPPSGAEADAADLLGGEERILEVPERPALMSTLVSDLRLTIDKPSFPLQELPDFLHKVGKGMPRDMKYGLLVPMHLQIEMGEARVALRDYPLPFLHVPGLKAGQSARNRPLVLSSDFVIAEEYRGPESTRRVRVNIVPPSSMGEAGQRGLSSRGGFDIDVRRTLGPVKSFSQVAIDVNSALPTRITWGPSYQPAVQDMMMAIESFTKPQIDSSDRVGFWDKLRLSFHSRIKVSWTGDGEMHLSLKGTRDPYVVSGAGAGFVMCWRNAVTWNINTEDDPKRFMTVTSGEYVLAVPDYGGSGGGGGGGGGTAADDESRRSALPPLEIAAATATGGAGDSLRAGTAFKKVAMKLSGRVQWLVGLVFERAIAADGTRSFLFNPHYDVQLKHPDHVLLDSAAHRHDAFRGFRSQHIHLSIAVRAVDGGGDGGDDWQTAAGGGEETIRGYNSVHLTPRFFTHFLAWWSLFASPLSLPIRQGRLFPGREKNSKKFGRHLVTVKYNVALAPLFLSHIYRHKDAAAVTATTTTAAGAEPSSGSSSASATGIKVRFDNAMLDLHQRREEFNTRDRGRKMQSRTSSIKIHAAQLDLSAADLRAVSATLVSRAGGKDAGEPAASSSSATESGPGPRPDTAAGEGTGATRDGGNSKVSHFTIPDNDFSWIDMDDFVELDWPAPDGPAGIGMGGAPDTKILPLAFAPRLTYFRQTDIGGVIEGDPDRTSPFGQEPTHVCEMTHDDDARRIQAGLIGERLAELAAQVAGHGRTVAEAEAEANGDDAWEGIRALAEHGDVLRRKQAFLQDMLAKTGGPRRQTAEGDSASPDVPVSEVGEGDGDGDNSGEESEFKNRFVVHNMQLKWNNTLRNVILRYIHHVGQRRGFVYYLSRPAVRFILDIVEEQAKAKRMPVTKETATSSSPNAPERDSARHWAGVRDGRDGREGTEGRHGKETLRDGQDIEDRIRQILQDGKRNNNNHPNLNVNVKMDTKGKGTGTSSGRGNGNGNAYGNAHGNVAAATSIEDLISGIAQEFAPQSSYQIRLIAPQIQLQSDQNQKHVVLVAAKGMELKVLEVMDRERLSDPVSGLVQRRFLVSMDGTQFFVAHQKWFASRLAGAYAGGRYGTPAGSSWPPWVPLEVMFDFVADPFGFKRVVHKTSGVLRYDKFNTLRLKYTDEISQAEEGGEPAEGRGKNNSGSNNNKSNNHGSGDKNGRGYDGNNGVDDKSGSNGDAIHFNSHDNDGGNNSDDNKNNKNSNSNHNIDGSNSNNNNVNGDGNGDGSSNGEVEARTDSLWVEFPQARAVCNSQQYYALYVIVKDLLLYSEPLERTRSERLEKIMLASDFSDLSFAPRTVERLQTRIRQLEEIRARFDSWARVRAYNAKGHGQGQGQSQGHGHSLIGVVQGQGQGQSQGQGQGGGSSSSNNSNSSHRTLTRDRALLERDLAACEDELFFTMKAITTSQRKLDSSVRSTDSLLKWTISARDIVWHLVRGVREPLVELQLRDVEYDRTDSMDGSHTNLIRVGKVLGLNLLPDATYPEIITPYVDADGHGHGNGNQLWRRRAPGGHEKQARAAHSGGGRGFPGQGHSQGRQQQPMVRVSWSMLEAIAGIPVMNYFEVNLFPMKIQLERDVGKCLFEYIFPDQDGDTGATRPGSGSGESPMQRQRQPMAQGAAATAYEDEGGDSLHDLSDSHAHTHPNGAAASAAASSLEQRLQPTLDSLRPADRSPRKPLSVRSDAGSSFRIFRSSTGSRTLARKASGDSLRSSAASASTAFGSGSNPANAAATTHTNVAMGPPPRPLPPRSFTALSSSSGASGPSGVGGAQQKMSRFMLRTKTVAIAGDGNGNGGGGGGGSGSGNGNTGGSGGGGNTDPGLGGAGGDDNRVRNRAQDDDLSMMMARASSYTTFAHIKMPSVVLCLSYKGKDKESRNLEDMYNFVFRMPTVEWRNKTWSNLDLFQALKKVMLRALVSHTGAIVANKLSRRKPVPGGNRPRDAATSSVVAGPQSRFFPGMMVGGSGGGGLSGTGPGSVASGSASASFLMGDARYTDSLYGSLHGSDDSSFYGTSPVDFSRSPPRSVRSAQGSIPASSTSRSPSVASARTGGSGNTGATGGMSAGTASASASISATNSAVSTTSSGGGIQNEHRTGPGRSPIPSFLMMTTSPMRRGSGSRSRSATRTRGEASLEGESAPNPRTAETDDVFHRIMGRELGGHGGTGPSSGPASGPASGLSMFSRAWSPTSASASASGSYAKRPQTAAGVGSERESAGMNSGNGRKSGTGHGLGSMLGALRERMHRGSEGRERDRGRERSRERNSREESRGWEDSAVADEETDAVEGGVESGMAHGQRTSWASSEGKKS